MIEDCQECIPAMLSMCSRMPAARNPEMTLETVLPACRVAILRGFSSFVYNDNVTVLLAGD